VEGLVEGDVEVVGLEVDFDAGSAKHRVDLGEHRLRRPPGRG
jgi:hypothetical protein